MPAPRPSADHRRAPPGRAAVVGLAVALLAACAPTPGAGPGDGGAGVDGGAAGSSGGVILVRVLGEGTAFFAEAFTRASAPLPGIPAPGRCVVTPGTPSALQILTVTDLDLGPSMTLTTGATTLVAPAGNGVFGATLNGVLPGTTVLQVVHDGPVVSYLASVALAAPPPSPGPGAPAPRSSTSTPRAPTPPPTATRLPAPRAS